MKTLLSLILSLVMVLGGGSLPAVPETATVYTLSDVMISTGEDTVFLNPKLVFTVAQGSEKLQAQFEVHSGDAVLLPLAGEINADGVAFKMGSGNPYSLSAETMDALTGGVEIPAEATELVDSFTAFLDAFEEMTTPENQIAASRVPMDYWYAADGVTPEEVDVVVGDQTLKGEKASLSLGVKDVYGALDEVAVNGTEAQKKYAAAMMDFMNTILKLAGSEEQVESFVDLIETLAAQDESGALAVEFPMDITSVINDELAYMEITSELEQDGMQVNLYANTLQDANGFNELMEATGAGEYEGGNTDMSMMMALSGDASGSMNVIADVSAVDNYSYEETAESGESYTWGGSSDVSLSMILAHRVSNSDMINTTFTADVLARESYFDESIEDYDYGYNTVINMNGQILDSVAEDMSINRAYYMAVSGNESDENGEVAEGSELNFALSFVVNKKEVPFADAFADAQFTSLPAEYQDAEGNPTAEYQQLMFEAMGLMGDVMVLASEESVVELVNLVNKLTGMEDIEGGVEMVEDGYFITPDGAITEIEDGVLAEEYEYSGLEYYFDASEEGAVVDMAAAAEAYGAEIPEFTAPEGWNLEYLYASEGYMSMDYGTGDTYFSLIICPSYNDGSYQSMTLNADGSLAENAGQQVQLMTNEDGTVAYAEFSDAEKNVTVYFDNASIETVQAVLAGF